MAHLNDFNAKKDIISAIKKVKRPSIPMSAYLEEAFNLQVWSNTDRPILLKAGLNPHFMDDLPLRTNACIYVQSLWVNERKTKHPAKKDWDKQLAIARQLKNTLISDFRYSFRKHPELLKKVSSITK